VLFGQKDDAFGQIDRRRHFLAKIWCPKDAIFWPKVCAATNLAKNMQKVRFLRTFCAHRALKLTAVTHLAQKRGALPR